MTAKELLLRIKTVFDGRGTADAQKQLGALAAETEKAKAAAGAAAGSSDKLGQSVGKAAELTGSLTAAMAAGGPEAQQLGAGLRVLKSIVEGSSAGLMGLATVLAGVVVSAYAAYTQKVADSKKKLAEFIEKVEDGKRAADSASVDRLAGQYDVLRRSLDDATAAQDRLNQAQAAADNAERAARMADITLREKQAQNGLAAGDQLGAARVAAQAAAERRDLEAEYALREAQRAAEAKARAVEDAARKADITEKGDIPAAKAELEKFADLIRRANEDLALIYGSGSPKKTVPDPNYYGYQAGPSGPKIQVVDEEVQSKLAESILKRLGSAKWESGKLVGEGFELNYLKAAEKLTAAIDRLDKERAELEARRIEASAAERAFGTARKYTPQINAAESTAAERGLIETAAAQKAAVDAALKDLSASFSGAPDSTLRAIQEMISSAERSGQLTVSWIKSLTESNQKLIREIDDLRNAARLRQ